MRIILFPIALVVGAALVACGGGGSDESSAGTGGDPVVVGPQQYPGGFWEGTSGTGSAQRSFFGYIDPGSSGTGGDFLFARLYAGTNGYDSVYGAGSATGSSFIGSDVNYYSGRDDKFVSGLTLRGAVSSAPGSTRPTRIVGNYGDPKGTAASTNAIVPFDIRYGALNAVPAQLPSLQGTYRSIGTFGAVWRLDIDAEGRLVGTYSGCTLTGNVQTRSATSAAYGVSLTLTGDQGICPRTGTSQTGVIALQYDAAGARSGIWLLSRNATGPSNVLALNGIIDPGAVPSPSLTQQDGQGNWVGKVGPVGSAQDITAAVLPDGSYFLYRKVGSGYDALYGTLAVSAGGGTVNSIDGVYFQNQSAQYNSGVALTGSVVTNTSFTGKYFDPSSGNTLTEFTVAPDPAYPYVTSLSAAPFNLSGTYRSVGPAFGGGLLTLTVDAALGTIVGDSSDGCTVTGNFSKYGSDPNRNAFTVDRLTYAGAACPKRETPPQSGVASGRFESGGGQAQGLRILAAAGNAAGTRATTVFVGSRIPTQPPPAPPATPPAQ